ncbi:MAG: hypothetical protein F2840_16375 [Actinobacteria bacterium]|uniref:Unannotated protein n=1 Tax=freshwater metagenome TaxID=449393 RepID=A0A6J7LN10_9ZZZZ|nr:hypothetical protein [Actinomycetota bacterium]
MVAKNVVIRAGVAVVAGAAGTVVAGPAGGVAAGLAAAVAADRVIKSNSDGNSDDKK